MNRKTADNQAVRFAQVVVKIWERVKRDLDLGRFNQRQTIMAEYLLADIRDFCAEVAHSPVKIVACEWCKKDFLKMEPDQVLCSTQCANEEMDAERKYVLLVPLVDKSRRWQ